MLRPKAQSLNLKTGYFATVIFHFRGRLARRRDSAASTAGRSRADQPGSCRSERERRFCARDGADRRRCHGSAAAGRPLDSCSRRYRGRSRGVDRFHAAWCALASGSIGRYGHQSGDDRSGHLVNRCAALRKKADRPARALDPPAGAGPTPQKWQTRASPSNQTAAHRNRVGARQQPVHTGPVFGRRIGHEKSQF